MSGFFNRKRPGSTGMAMFLNAGDPPFGQIEDLVLFLDRAGIDCLELAVPFPDSVSDGPVIRRSAGRALAHGTGTAETLDFVARIRPKLRHLRIALLADYSHTVRPLGLDEFLHRTAGSGADAILVHALPPLLRQRCHEAAARAALPVVTTCYMTSPLETIRDAARDATAYVYLAASRGRTGATPEQGYQNLKPLIRILHDAGTSPVAVGFGVGSREHIADLRDAGADAAIIGSAFVARLERAMDENRNPVSEAAAFLTGLRNDPSPCFHN
jgi:tryptophan synthase alpha chain